MAQSTRTTPSIAGTTGLRLAPARIYRLRSTRLEVTRSHNAPRRLAAALLVVLVVAAGVVGLTRFSSHTPAAQPKPLTKDAATAAFGRLPLAFEPNVGQADASARFVARTGAGMLALTPTGSVLSGPGGTLTQRFMGANPKPTITGAEPLAGKVNYLRGDPSTWRSNVSTFAKVVYHDVYPGIDVAYYGNAEQLEYDLVVAPGADPSTIAWTAEGATGIHLDNGDLVMNVGGAEVRHRRPVAYQTSSGRRTPVAADYRLGTNGTVSFSVSAYNRAKALVIDPLVYSSFLGGSSGGTVPKALALDGDGNIYVAGQTRDADFPIAGTPVQSSHSGPGDGFVTELNSTGSAFVYSTYLGGSWADGARGLAVDSSGNAYVVGFTYSPDFPGATTFPGAPSLAVDPQQSNRFADGHSFLAKLNSSGSALLYSRFLGGNSLDNINAIAIDGSGNAYLTGETHSSNFPVVGGFQSTEGGGYDAFVTKVNPLGTALVYSSYLGGSATEHESGYGIAVDTSGYAYVVGLTKSADFPVAGMPFQATQPGLQSGFVTKVNPAGSGLVYSTYLGGSNFTDATAVALDPAGDAFVTGNTDSSDFPTAGSPFQPAIKGSSDVFITKLNPTGSGLVYSTFLGGSGLENPGDEVFGTGGTIAVDSAGIAHVAGATKSSDFPVVRPIQPLKRQNEDVYVARLSADGSSLLFSTYLGSTATQDNVDEAFGIAVDAAGNDVITGIVGSDFPTAGSPLQPTSRGAPSSGVVAKLKPGGAPGGASPDFNGDGSTDISVFRPSNGTWYVNGGLTTTWGTSGDVPVACDYDGNGSANVAVFRPSNSTWYLQGIGARVWGTTGDIPVPGDYDGDGFCDIAVFRPSDGTWYVNGVTTTTFGTSGDIPVPGDYNGDGKIDLAVYRPSTGTWYIHPSGGGPDIVTVWGTNGDIPVPGDYNNDGKTDVAVFRPSDGTWYVNGGTTTAWGTSGDIPAPGDYTGDGTTDIAVFRPSTGLWYVNGGAVTPWGTSGDIPLPLPAAIQSSSP